MLFGFDGTELGLVIVFVCVFVGIMTGFPVAFAIGGSALIAFLILAILGDSGLLQREVVDTGSEEFRQLVASGVDARTVTRFRFPELPTVLHPLFERGAEGALHRTLTFIVNRMNERVLAGQSIETLLAVAMFVLMGIALERSRIAEDLLTTMAKVFGPLPGGLAVSVVVVGAFLAASTGIVGATVVTMGLLSLPTMLRRGYSPELATGVITASGTLGQIIPPSIVIVLLGTLVGDLYSTGQETRAQLAGCPDALTFLGQAAVLSVGTLFQAALIPGIMLAVLYGAYAFLYALFRPDRAPPIYDETERAAVSAYGMQRNLFWYLGVPAMGVLLVAGAIGLGIAGSQVPAVGTGTESGTILRTHVSEQCKASMIELHGQEKWDEAVAAQSVRDQQAVIAGRTPEAAEAQRQAAIAAIPPLSAPLLVSLVILALMMTTAFATAPQLPKSPYVVGGAGLGLALLADFFLVGPGMTPGEATVVYALPIVLIAYGMRHTLQQLFVVELVRVVFPPLILMIAVLGSIIGGITNPTPAAALGAAGAIMLAAHRRLERQGDGRFAGRAVIWSAYAIVILLLVGVNFDLRTGIETVRFENWLAITVATIAYHVAFAGLLYACWVLLAQGLLTPIVRETAKITAMVFAILIGSQMLNLVVISFGGEEYVQSFLRSFDQEWVVFLIVMLVLFILGFVLDFLEIIYIVIPIVGPVIYGGTLDPKWVTIMIAINLQTSFLTPPFGFALFYLRGVAPPSVTTGHIYRGVVPFVLIQIVGLALLWLFPQITTFLPDILP